MPTPLLLVITCLALVACAPAPEDADKPPVDTLTQRQRDSAIGASRLPGAGAVNRALDTSRAADERAERIDSILP